MRKYIYIYYFNRYCMLFAESYRYDFATPVQAEMFKGGKKEN